VEDAAGELIDVLRRGRARRRARFEIFDEGLRNGGRTISGLEERTCDGLALARVSYGGGD